MLKIQFLNGGLANQAFQYIFARHYELLHPGEIMYLDDSYFALNNVHNGYELEKVFGIKPHMISGAFDADVWEYMLELKKTQNKSLPQLLKDNGVCISMLSQYSNPEKFNPFDGPIYYLSAENAEQYYPQAQNIVDLQEIYYHGYWVNKGWFERFKPQFLEEFKFPEISDDYNKALMYKILNESVTALHIRRGDYVEIGQAFDAAEYGELVQTYLDNFGGASALFVFSDDIAWCRKNSGEMGLDKFKECVFVEGNKLGKNYIDMQLMSCCEGMIFGNSAFAFLAALLNQRKKHWAARREF